MKKRQILSIALLAVLAMLFIFEIVAVIAVARLKMLPGILVFLIALVFFAYDCLVAYFMFLRIIAPRFGQTILGDPITTQQGGHFL